MLVLIKKRVRQGDSRKGRLRGLPRYGNIWASRENTGRGYLVHVEVEGLSGKIEKGCKKREGQHKDMSKCTKSTFSPSPYLL